MIWCGPVWTACQRLVARLWLRPLLALAGPGLAGALLGTTPAGRLIAGGLLVCGLIGLVWHRLWHRTWGWRRVRQQFVAAKTGWTAADAVTVGNSSSITSRIGRTAAVLAVFLFGVIRMSLVFGPSERLVDRALGSDWSGEVRVISQLSSYTTAQGEARAQVVVMSADSARLAVHGPRQLMIVGNRLRLEGRLGRPDLALNPGGFDQRDWLWRQGVLMVLYRIQPEDILVVQPAGDGWIQSGVASIRRWLDVRSQAMVGPQLAPLLTGLLIGERSGLEPALEYHFRQAGLSHLTAVSGANIAFWLTPLTLLLRRCRLGRTIRQSVLLLALIGFGFLTGWQVSVSRALVMAALVLIGRLVHRRADPLNSLGAAILIFLLISPLSLLGFGFWLSLLATLGLLAGAPLLSQKMSTRWPSLPKSLFEWVGLNTSVQILVLPASLMLSHQISLIGWVANIPAVLLVEGITLVGCVLFMLAAVLDGGAGLLGNLFGSNGLMGVTPSLAVNDLLNWAGQPLAMGLDYLTGLARWCSRLDIGRWSQRDLNLPLCIAFVLVGLLLWGRIPLKLRRRGQLGLIGALVSGLLVWQVVPRLAPQDEVWFLSVGQGDATLIITRSGESILIDTGKPGSGWQVILPALDAIGIRRIDQLIVTHDHADHAGGVAELIESGRVDRLVQPDVDRQALGIDGTILLNSGRDRLTVLGSPMTIQSEDLNESAMHFSLVLQDRHILLMSDCTPGIEADLLAKDQLDPALVLKVAHHGSSATTTTPFLQQVRPALAVISVGLNTYGHPTPELLGRLERERIRTWRTDRQGAIVVTVRDSRLNARTWLTQK